MEHHKKDRVAAAEEEIYALKDEINFRGGGNKELYFVVSEVAETFQNY